MLRPTLMTNADLAATIAACTHILGCDERYGMLDRGMRATLERLLNESAALQVTRGTKAAARLTVPAES